MPFRTFQECIPGRAIQNVPLPLRAQGADTQLLSFQAQQEAQQEASRLTSASLPVGG